MTKRHPGGVAHYPGDQTHIVGELKGPTTFNSYLTAVSAEYDEETDKTTVQFAYSTLDDVDKSVKDEFGVVRVPHE
jgi:hypothetical protein